MRKVFIIPIVMGMLINAFGQESRNKMIEQRAREFHRILGLDDSSEWKNFIKENYSKALIEKPMKSVVRTSDQRATESTTTYENIEEKAAMLQRLHQDFGNSKIVSIKPKEENLAMILESNAGLTGAFNLKFSKDAPYLLDGIGIEVGR